MHLHHTDIYANMYSFYNSSFHLQPSYHCHLQLRSTHGATKPVHVCKPRISYIIHAHQACHLLILCSLLLLPLLIVECHSVALQATVISSGQFKSLCLCFAHLTFFFCFFNWHSFKLTLWIYNQNFQYLQSVSRQYKPPSYTFAPNNDCSYLVIGLIDVFVLIFMAHVTTSSNDVYSHRIPVTLTIYTLWRGA
jgi:hypothetical protein